jgi:two-component system cell cycle sensor histidine kinase/response regulator CckA
VEDEEGVRELAEMLLQAEGYSVLSAETPAQAEQICAKHAGTIHLLLTDVVMPGSSGRELAQRITANSPHTRVLYMSGYTDDVITHGGMLDPGIAFLQKPFTPAALARKIREVLDAPAAVKRR